MNASPAPSQPYASVAEWAVGESVAFSLDADRSFEQALDPIVQALGDEVQLLGFGEALHGSEELMLLRNRLFRRLVEAHGYSAIAIESSFPRGRLTNDYVLGRGGDDYAAIREAGFGHGAGQIEANRELVEWMRDYNADPTHATKLHFYGFDLPSVAGGPETPGPLLTFALDYLAVHDAASAQRLRVRIEPQLGEPQSWEDPMAWRDPERGPLLLERVTALRVEAEELICALRMLRPEPAVAAAPEAFDEALQYAITARELLNFFAALARGGNYADSLAVRDALMADLLEYIVAAERTRGKVLVFAHNKHLQRSQAVWEMGSMRCAWWPAGAYAARRLGARYALIGSAIVTSEQNGIAPPEPGTLEALLSATPGPGRMTQTLAARTLEPNHIRTTPLRTASKKNGSYFPLNHTSFTDFDALLTLDSTVYYRGGRTLP